ncbi:AzlC family ABC transporter permease [Pseudahrensia aquimaris]|uniref:AzlC family ABC transporter permease n=1 Tax=Pseudahrensia aquimaris TaxID=744461 RepID=A0ABW3FHG3_9HYPH
MSAADEIGGAEAVDFRREFSAALRDVTPVMIAVLPFGALFAALAVGQGLPKWEVVFASATIFAGASQYAMLDLLGQQVPYWAIVLTVVAINFRHVLYSATIGRAMGRFSTVQKAGAFFFLMDPLFAAAESRRRNTVLNPSYFFSYGIMLYAAWMVANGIGAFFGTLIDDPAAWGFDMLLPVYFIGLVMGFRKALNFVPVLAVSVATSLVIWWTIGAPWNVTLGGLAGLLCAAAMSKPKVSSKGEAAP